MREEIEGLKAELEKKNKALKYAIRFLNPVHCDKVFVIKALKGSEE